MYLCTIKHLILLYVMANTLLRIKALAKERKVRLEDIAVQLGISRVAFQQSLARNNMSIERLGEIADILNVEIPELFEASQPSSMKCPHCGKPINVTIS